MKKIGIIITTIIIIFTIILLAIILLNAYVINSTKKKILTQSEIQKKWNDFVFVVKTKVKLDKKNILSLKSFYKNLNFLINKI